VQLIKDVLKGALNSWIQVYNSKSATQNQGKSTEISSNKAANDFLEACLSADRRFFSMYRMVQGVKNLYPCPKCCSICEAGGRDPESIDKS